MPSKGHIAGSDATSSTVHTQILGNLVPHLHAHIQPRFYGDAYPGQPVSGAPEHLVFLTADEYLERISAYGWLGSVAPVDALQTRLSGATQHDWHNLLNRVTLAQGVHMLPLEGPAVIDVQHR